MSIVWYYFGSIQVTDKTTSENLTDVAINTDQKKNKSGMKWLQKA